MTDCVAETAIAGSLTGVVIGLLVAALVLWLDGWRVAFYRKWDYLEIHPRPKKESR